jgi:sugar/nucleoside kinase (ribokinase family)
MDFFMDDLKEALKEVDVLTINDEEARQLSEEYSLVTAAKKILIGLSLASNFSREAQAFIYVETSMVSGRS